MIMLPLIDNSLVQLLLAALGLILIVMALRGCLRFWYSMHRRQSTLIDQINALLPQTQCGQCSYEGCLPYARAIARGAPINQCPPGGSDTILRLARLLNDHPQPLNPAHGKLEPARVAFIREAECIGCTKCIKACPVDAILGGAKLMHTVITSECTGCDLCVAPCPVDCIDMLPLALHSDWHWQLPTQLHAADYPLDRSPQRPLLIAMETHS